MMSLAIIVAVLLQNVLTRRASTSGTEDGNCQQTNQAFREQTCGAAAAPK
jgi:hypothetical protein